jgi:hypothetical protein
VRVEAPIHPSPRRDFSGLGLEGYEFTYDGERWSKCNEREAFADYLEKESQQPMYHLGISDETGLVFEGASTSRALAIVPPPLLFPIRFSTDGVIVPISTRYSGYPETIFREDSFDPVSKIRRGRVFALGGIQPARWGLPNSPIINGKLESEIRFITYERNMLADIRDHTFGITAARYIQRSGFSSIIRRNYEISAAD